MVRYYTITAPLSKASPLPLDRTRARTRESDHFIRVAASTRIAIQHPQHTLLHLCEKCISNTVRVY